jgi:predicted DNA-binding transcriptional regulator YafY
VTRLPDEKAVPVELIFQKEQAPYIQTKPMHPSQKVKQLEDGRLQVRLHLIPNYEFVSQLLSFGEKVEVVAPKSLRMTIKKRLKDALDQY